MKIRHIVTGTEYEAALHAPAAVSATWVEVAELGLVDPFAFEIMELTLGEFNALPWEWCEMATISFQPRDFAA